LLTQIHTIFRELYLRKHHFTSLFQVIWTTRYKLIQDIMLPLGHLTTIHCKLKFWMLHIHFLIIVLVSLRVKLWILSHKCLLLPTMSLTWEVVNQIKILFAKHPKIVKLTLLYILLITLLLFLKLKFCQAKAMLDKTVRVSRLPLIL